MKNTTQQTETLTASEDFFFFPELLYSAKTGGGRIKDYRKYESLRRRKECSCQQQRRKVKAGRIFKWSRG